MRYIILSMIKLYRKAISPAFPPSCRFYPSCSEYGLQAIGKYGVLKGGYLTLLRILKCNPFTKGGYDPLE